MFWRRARRPCHFLCLWRGTQHQVSMSKCGADAQHRRVGRQSQPDVTSPPAPPVPPVVPAWPPWPLTPVGAVGVVGAVAAGAVGAAGLLLEAADGPAAPAAAATAARPIIHGISPRHELPICGACCACQRAPAMWTTCGYTSSE